MKDAKTTKKIEIKKIINNNAGKPITKRNGDKIIAVITVRNQPNAFKIKFKMILSIFMYSNYILCIRVCK